MSLLITIIVLRVLIAIARAVDRPEPVRPAPPQRDRVLHPAEYELR